MRILRASAPKFWEQWERLRAAASPRTALYTRLDVEYLKNYPEPWEAENLSFVIEDDDTVFAGAMMALKSRSEGNDLSAFGRSILYLERRGMTQGRVDSLSGLVKDELERIRSAHSIRGIRYQNPEGCLTVVGRYLMGEGARAFPSFAQIIDLDPDETALRGLVRKSYKSLINWGEKNLRPYILDWTNLTDVEFEEYRGLHLLAAGRETRCRDTWRINADMIRSGEAFLVLGRLDGRLVTGACFNVFADACYYSNAASDRGLFEKPLGHCVIWRGMLHARSIGCRILEMGEVLFPNQPKADPGAETLPDEKNLNIATFKKGFGGRTECRIDVLWRAR